MDVFCVSVTQLGCLFYTALSWAALLPGARLWSSRVGEGEGVLSPSCPSSDQQPAHVKFSQNGAEDKRSHMRPPKVQIRNLYADASVHMLLAKVNDTAKPQIRTGKYPSSYKGRRHNGVAQGGTQEQMRN